ncbi:MAG: fumarylacetoacetate hydrolase family protein [Candidatus Nanopelagicales bacterium]
MLITRVAMGDEVVFAAVDGVGASGQLEPGATVSLIDAHPFGGITLTGRTLPAAQVRMLAPILPSKIVAVGKNYAAHAAEMGGEVPGEPMIFFKPNTAVIGPGAPIVLPPSSKEVELEAELAVVVGRMCRNVPREKAADVILGYTVANDVTARDQQRSDQQWGRAKGYDTFCPLGPWINTDIDVTDVEIWSAINGVEAQHASTRTMVRDVPTLVAFISTVMTLLPGDVILTGTPAGVAGIHDGDSVTVAVDGIGQLSNPVKADAGDRPW